jgi:hypothetical protein
MKRVKLSILNRIKAARAEERLKFAVRKEVENTVNIDAREDITLILMLLKRSLL